MRRFCLFNVAIFAVACGGATQTGPSAPAQDAKRQADRNIVGTAEGAGGGAPLYTCGDTVLNDQKTSGTERVTSWVTCEQVPNTATPPPPMPRAQPDPSEAIPLPPTNPEENSITMGPG